MVVIVSSRVPRLHSTIILYVQLPLTSSHPFPHPHTLTPSQEEQDDQLEEVDDPFRPVQPSPMLDIGDTTGGGLQGVLGQLFGVLLPEIESFITFGERLDN